MSYDDDQNADGPKALRDALEKANKALDAQKASNEALQKQVNEQALSGILRDKNVPANVQRWIKRDGIDPTAEAVEKWLAENGSDFNLGSVEASEGASSEEAQAQVTAVAPVSALTAEDIATLQRVAEAFGVGNGASIMPLDQQKAAVDQVAAHAEIGYAGTDYAAAVRQLADAGIPIEGTVAY